MEKESGIGKLLTSETEAKQIIEKAKTGKLIYNLYHFFFYKNL